jgi:integrase
LLYEATRKNAADPKKARYRWHAEHLHDFVLFMANTGLRPDESGILQFRDVEIVDDKATGQRILEIEVRGKRGVGYCKSMPGAVRPFERLRDRERPSGETGADGTPVMAPPKPTDLLFPNEFKKMFNGLLEENNLKFDRAGKARTAYSLRHSYICFRLLEGADICSIHLWRCAVCSTMLKVTVSLWSVLRAGGFQARTSPSLVLCVSSQSAGLVIRWTRYS